jgi:hypothetical protein
VSPVKIPPPIYQELRRLTACEPQAEPLLQRRPDSQSG